MVKRNFLRLGMLAVTCMAAEIAPPESGLVVHEWGTFTTVADHAGNSMDWLPLTAPSDVPCFVHHFEGNLKFITWGKVRMETPVLYFYAGRPMTASVKVDFPKGIITEWYPRANRDAGWSPTTISWNPIHLSSSRSAVPQEDKPSHYYAARETDAMTVETKDGERDRMIFYRGIGDFAIPLHPVVTTEGRVQMENPRAIVFENRGKNDGSEVARKQLYEALLDSGLYPKEAHAMLETWRDSWFEEGLRVFYIVPREMVDAVLPITVLPRPEKLVRTFVGRIELLAPWMRDEINTAMKTGDLETLARRGRFLEAFLTQMGNQPRSASVQAWLDAKRIEGSRKAASGACD